MDGAEYTHPRGTEINVHVQPKHHRGFVPTFLALSAIAAATLQSDRI